MPRPRLGTPLIALLVLACAGDGAPPAAPAADALRAQYARPPAEWPAPELDPGVPHHELAPLPAAPALDEARVELGRLLFFDPRLSSSGQIACASCHDPDLAWADGRTVSFGHGRKPLRRNAPAIRNAGLRSSQFWDGRAATLEDLVLEVMANPDEMAAQPVDVAQVLGRASGYRERFAAVFGDPQPAPERIAAAVADFVRSLSGSRSRFDRFLEGDATALDDAELRGLHLFRTRARCLNCHSGPLLADEDFHNLGLTWYGRELEDLGRHLATGEPADTGRFRTPSLRDVTRTGPWMHNGLFPLEGVINIYANGGVDIRPAPEQEGDPRFPVKSPRLRPLELSREDKADLLAFLGALEEPPRRVRPPELPALDLPDAGP